MRYRASHREIGADRIFFRNYPPSQGKTFRKGMNALRPRVLFGRQSATRCGLMCQMDDYGGSRLVESQNAVLPYRPSACLRLVARHKALKRTAEGDSVRLLAV